MVLIDTSSWSQSLRRVGDAVVRERVRKLVLSGDAAWCDMVRVELWNGVSGDHEKRQLREFDEALTCFSIDKPVWDLACAISRFARSHSVTVPNADLVIYACARHHDVEIEHSDRHFDALKALKLNIRTL